MASGEPNSRSHQAAWSVVPWNCSSDQMLAWVMTQRKRAVWPATQFAMQPPKEAPMAAVSRAPHPPPPPPAGLVIPERTGGGLAGHPVGHAPSEASDYGRGPPLVGLAGRG